jgi:hypothetical protein
VATYINDNGDTIETNNSVYSIFDVNKILIRFVDVSKWSSNAEKWIDNDIASGYYAGFRKVSA